MDQDLKKLARDFKATLSEELQVEEDQKSYRAFPHSEFPVLVEDGESRVLKKMSYSLVPSWSKERKPNFATYNARIETICEKPTWKSSLRKYRCLVPLSSFYESCHGGSHGGHIVEFQSSQLWMVAGLWSVWQNAENQRPVHSFAIVTTEPSDFIEGIGHDRSPLFLSSSSYDSWLNPVVRNCNDAKSFLLNNHQPLADAQLKIERALKDQS